MQFRGVKVDSLKKICKKCNEPKSITEFHKDKRKTYGVSPICKACKSAKYFKAKT